MYYKIKKLLLKEVYRNIFLSLLLGISFLVLFSVKLPDKLSCKFLLKESLVSIKFKEFTEEEVKGSSYVNTSWSYEYSLLLVFSEILLLSDSICKEYLFGV